MTFFNYTSGIKSAMSHTSKADARLNISSPPKRRNDIFIFYDDWPEGGKFIYVGGCWKRLHSCNAWQGADIRGQTKRTAPHRSQQYGALADEFFDMFGSLYLQLAQLDLFQCHFGCLLHRGIAQQLLGP